MGLQTMYMQAEMRYQVLRFRYRFLTMLYFTTVFSKYHENLTVVNNSVTTCSYSYYSFSSALDYGGGAPSGSPGKTRQSFHDFESPERTIDFMVPGRMFTSSGAMDAWVGELNRESSMGGLSFPFSSI